MKIISTKAGSKKFYKKLQLVMLLISLSTCAAFSQLSGNYTIGILMFRRPLLTCMQMLNVGRAFKPNPGS